MTSILHSGFREAPEARVGHGFHEVTQVEGGGMISFPHEAEHGIGPGMDFTVEHAVEMDVSNGNRVADTGEMDYRSK